MTAEYLKMLLRYNGWANGKILSAVEHLPKDALTRNVSISHESIFKTLAHIYWADAVWFTRVANPNETIHEPKTLPELKLRWRQLQSAWEEWIGQQDDASLKVNIVYQSKFGGEFENPAWELVAHVVNHATLHRGQVMGMIRQLGIEPPHTDLLFYSRDMAAERALPEA